MKMGRDRDHPATSAELLAPPEAGRGRRTSARAPRGSTALTPSAGTSALQSWAISGRLGPQSAALWGSSPENQWGGTSFPQSPIKDVLLFSLSVFHILYPVACLLNSECVWDVFSTSSGNGPEEAQRH